MPGSHGIDGYALIGNCRAAALVGRDGSVDWLCWPRYDSPSLFGAVLDQQRGGRFAVRPVGSFETSRKYVTGTNVLETRFRGPSGAAVLRDCFSLPGDANSEELWPDHELLRDIECTHGEIELEVVYEPRPDYARAPVRLTSRPDGGIWLEQRGGAVVLRADVPLTVVGGADCAFGRIRLVAGERRQLSLAYNRTGPAVLPILGDAARQRIQRTVAWWKRWAGACTYAGAYKDAVLRSALVLKLLTYAPSGAVVAAPTTSLPEQPGGTWNWDYRYCWLRDTALVVRALFALGHHPEANAFVSWLVQATRLTWPRLQVLYDVFGEARIAETELANLAGYAGSKPVRIGNAAWGQLQLDVYGEVIDAAARFIAQGGRFDRQGVRLLDDLGQTVCRQWREPDAGIWESRGPRLHHTHSKVMCWVALDRLVRLHEAGHVDVRVEAFKAERAAIHSAIEQHGYNAQLGSYTSTFDGDQVDANLLLLPVYGYVSGTDARMMRTTELVLKRLGRGDLVRRHEGPGWQNEGAFGACSFWAVEALALSGQRARAHERFDELLRRANDVGLYSEEIDMDSGAALGNFPQAFTHIALINTALTLQRTDDQSNGH